MNTEKDNEKDLEAAADAVVEKYRKVVEDLRKMEILHRVEREKSGIFIITCAWAGAFVLSFVTSFFFFGKNEFPLVVFCVALTLFMFLKNFVDFRLVTKETQDYLDLLNKYKE